MILRWMFAAGLLALAPVAALAFETADDLPYPSSGAFPAWPGERVAPWTLYAYAGAMYDSNPFRRSTGERSDMVARYGLGGRSLTRVVGRQSVLLDGVAEYYDFNRLSEIDHLAYAARGQLHFEIGNQINGAAGYSRRRRHADLGEFRVERRAMVTTEQWLLDGGYRFAPSWRVFGYVDHTRESRDTDAVANLNSTTLRSSLTYTTALGNAFGVEVRGTQGDARIGDEFTGIPFTDDFKEREISALVSYGLGAQLRVGGRIGHTERSYEDLPQRDFSGTTYRGRVDWLPTGKLIFSFEAFKVPSSIIEIDASHVLRTGTAFGVSWAATYKLVFTARFVNERRENQGDPAVALLGIAPRDETLRFWRFGAGWEPQRHWQVGAGFDIGERTSNRLGRDYEYNQVMLNLRFTY